MSRIRNRTSGVPVDRSVMLIEKRLVAAGARGIQKTYGPTGELLAIVFSITVASRREPVNVRVPADPDGVLRVLERGVRRPRKGTTARLRDQALRTAWKLVHDWVDVQLSMVELQQTELVAVFLPYLWDGNTTFFQALKTDGFKLLPGSHT